MEYKKGVIVVTNMGISDIPLLLEMSGSAISNATLFGLLVPDIQKPVYFENVQQKRKSSDSVALIDLVGVEVSGQKSYAKGQVFTVVDSSLVEIARRKPSGRLGVVLTGGALRLNKSNDDFTSFCRWTKGVMNTWQITSVNATLLAKESHPEFFDMIFKGHSQNWNFPYPRQVDASYRPASHGYSFAMLDGSYFDKEKVVDPSNVMNNVKQVANQPPQAPPQQPSWSSSTPPVPEAPASLFNTGYASSFGGSNQSNISEMNRNMVYTHQDNIAAAKSKLKKVQCRDEVIEPSKNLNVMYDAVEDSDEKVNQIIKHLEKSSKDDIVIKKETNDEGEEVDVEVSSKLMDAMDYTIAQLTNSWERTAGALTGRALFKEACERIIDEKHFTKDATGQSTLDMLLMTLGSRILDTLSFKPIEVGEDKKFKDCLGDITGNAHALYFQMLDILLGTGSKLSQMYREKPLGISVHALLDENPYMLCFVDPRLNIEDLDKVGMYMGVDYNDINIIRTRNVAFLHNYMLDASNAIIQENTIVPYNLLTRNIKAGFIFSKVAYNNLQTDGTIVRLDRIESLNFYFNPNTQPQSFALKQDGWIPAGQRFLLEIKGVNTESMIQDFIKSGLGVDLTLNNRRFIADYVFAKKELYIYNRLYELATQTEVKDLSDKEIEGCRQTFEKIKSKELNITDGSFKLEERQADALKLIRNPVMCLTGPAGSGKTTTAEALVFGAETMLGFNEDSILFCAPTGKAANRLKEVVKRKTKTINSLFGIGGDSVMLKDPDDIRKRDTIRLLVMDETSMPNLNLFYEMLLRIDDGTHMYFLGDIEQLPPIGFGKPFANMLQFLPTVVLNVTKRASDKSGITFNSKRIIEESDGIIEDLEERDDFRIIHTQDVDKAVKAVCDIVSYHLGKGSAEGFTPVTNMGTDVNPDDIQVITPINGKNWGVKPLNDKLQDIFNPLQPRETHLNFMRGKDDTVQFRKRDRVIHTRANQKDRQRLIHIEGTMFKEDDNVGIANGDVGKIIGFFKPSSLDFTAEESEESQANLKRHYGGSDEQVVYIGVKYKDTDAITGEPYDFVILYRAEITLTSGYLLSVVSRDLQNLDLAYALSTQKLQGSEAKLVLCIFFRAGRKGFISRNMLYTAISRGKQSEYLLGDILGKQSIVNQGRRYEQTEMRQTMLDMF